MADDRAGAGAALPLDLLERGDPAFVDALRAVDDAGALADFAGPWHDDRRPASRRLLLDYLDRPPNAYRHEGLIKRLFRRAEAAGDDEVMARFLVLLDRSIRRGRRGSTMPRGRIVADASGRPTPDWAVRFGLDWHGAPGPPELRDFPAVSDRREGLRLFSVATRGYLRRRAWRYFRRLGWRDPARYLAAASEALALYRDDDADGPALLDSWGLVHLLYHHSPILEARPSGWRLAEGRSIAELAPEPAFGKTWASAPGTVAGLLARAQSRTVRRWAVRLLRGDPARARAAYPPGGWVGLLGHDDPEVVGLAAEVLGDGEGLEAVDADRWVALVESAGPASAEVVAELVGRIVGADRVTTDQAARLAILGPEPAARLGFSWLVARGRPDDPALPGLVEAGCRPLRPEILRWLRGVLEPSSGAVLAFLESRHADARAEGLDWFRSDPAARADPATWRRLFESPHPEVRLALVAALESESRPAGAGSPRGLWAAVLLDIHRGSRARPAVVGQVIRALEASPEEAPDLLPLLGLALRSVRAPDRRAGLAAVVGLVGRRPEFGPMVRSAFPELQWA